MKKTLLTLTLITFCAAAAANQPLNEVPAEFLPAAKAVIGLMKDPDSARFRKLRPEGTFLCGEVNGKNSYGGYGGFTPFVVGLDGAGPQIATDWYDIRPIRKGCGQE